MLFASGAGCQRMSHILYHFRFFFHVCHFSRSYKAETNNAQELAALKGEVGGMGTQVSALREQVDKLTGLVESMQLTEQQQSSKQGKGGKEGTSDKNHISNPKQEGQEVSKDPQVLAQEQQLRELTAKERENRQAIDILLTKQTILEQQLEQQKQQGCVNSQPHTTDKLPELDLSIIKLEVSKKRRVSGSGDATPATAIAAGQSELQPPPLSAAPAPDHDDLMMVRMSSLDSTAFVGSFAGGGAELPSGPQLQADLMGVDEGEGEGSAPLYSTRYASANTNSAQMDADSVGLELGSEMEQLNVHYPSDPSDPRLFDMDTQDELMMLDIGLNGLSTPSCGNSDENHCYSSSSPSSRTPPVSYYSESCPSTMMANLSVQSVQSSHPTAATSTAYGSDQQQLPHQQTVQNASPSASPPQSAPPAATVQDISLILENLSPDLKMRFVDKLAEVMGKELSGAMARVPSMTISATESGDFATVVAAPPAGSEAESFSVSAPAAPVATAAALTTRMSLRAHRRTNAAESTPQSTQSAAALQQRAQTPVAQPQQAQTLIHAQAPQMAQTVTSFQLPSGEQAPTIALPLASAALGAFVFSSLHSLAQVNHHQRQQRHLPSAQSAMSTETAAAAAL